MSDRETYRCCSECEDRYHVDLDFKDTDKTRVCDWCQKIKTTCRLTTDVPPYAKPKIMPKSAPPESLEILVAETRREIRLSVGRTRYHLSKITKRWYTTDVTEGRSSSE